MKTRPIETPDEDEDGVWAMGVGFKKELKIGTYRYVACSSTYVVRFRSP